MFLLCQFQQQKIGRESGLEIRALRTNKNRQDNSGMMSQLTHHIDK